MDRNEIQRNGTSVILSLLFLLLTALALSVHLKLGNARESVHSIRLDHEQRQNSESERAEEFTERFIERALTPAALPAGLSDDDWRQMRGLIRQESYEVNEVRSDGSGRNSFQADNVRHEILTRFEPDGVRVIPSGTGKQSWEWGMRLRAYGYQGNMQTPGDAYLVAEANRMEYRRGQLVEWYINDARGLEQGFTLDERPPGGGGGELVIEVEWEGSLELQWLEEEPAIRFEEAEGGRLLKYSGLLAWDSTGEMLPVHMAELDNGWSLHVADREAVYPVTIDPVITNESAKLVASDGTEGDKFGFSTVAVSGNTVVVGALGDDDNGSDSGSAYVFVRSGTTWVEESKLRASDGAAGDWFGASVAVSGDTVVVGARFGDDNGTQTGSAYVFVRSGTNWTEATKLVASDGAAGDRFGDSVAISGDTVVVGASDDDDNGIDSGSAYVFVRSGATWVESTKLVASDGAVLDHFGVSIAASGDTVVVAVRDDDDNGNQSGSAYVFVRSGTNWAEATKLVASDGAAGDQFAFSIAVSGDTVVVGARGDDDKGSRTGSVYVFVRTGTNWAEATKLVASDGAAGDEFGYSVAVSGDTVVVGARVDDDKGSSSGSAYVFVRSGTAWSEATKLAAFDGAAGDEFGRAVAIFRDTAVVGTGGDGAVNNGFIGSAHVFANLPVGESTKLVAFDGAANDVFGRSVAVSGNTAVVGADGDDDNGSNSGSAYVYPNLPAGESAKLVASDGATGDQFGFSVAISGDMAVVGAWGDDDNGSNSGSAYLFMRNGPSWTETIKLTASDGAAGDLFGFSVAISGDTVVVGALGDDDNGSDSGSAYVFVQSGTTWAEATKLAPSDGAANDEFGLSVAVSGDTAVVGARRDDDNGSSSGSAYVFTGNGTNWAEATKLVASDGAANDEFGLSVAVSGDTVVVGAWADDDTGNSSGSAYVFMRNGTNWGETSKLVASDGVANDEFGYSVAVSGDTAVVGARRDDDYGSDSGSAYVFVRSGTNWAEATKLVASLAATGDQFGISVTVSGNTVVVGASMGDDNGNSSGSVFVFVILPGGGETTGYSIVDRGGVSWTSSGAGAAVNIGYGIIQPDGIAAPTGLAIFGLKQNGVLLTEASVPAVVPIQQGRIFAEVAGAVNTGLAIANPNDVDATINFFFTDTSGTNFASGSLTLGANQQTAKFLNEAPFSGGDPLLGTFTFTSSVPISVIALRGLTNERSEFLITTLPVVPLSPGTADTIYFPHFADGSGWITQVILVNPTDATISGIVEFLGQGAGTTPADPVSLGLDDGRTGSSFAYSIPARSSQRFTTSNPPGVLSVGSVRATADAGSSIPSGLGIFSLASGGVTVSGAGVPTLPMGTAFRVYVEASGTIGQVGSIRTGLAITDASGMSNMVTLELSRLDGAPVGFQTLTLPPSGQVARFVDELFSLPADFSGILRITSMSDIAIVGLRGRTNERSDFLITTTPPSNEVAAPASMATFFPHIVDSGGWSTQFVLFSGTAGQTFSGALSFVDQTGQLLDLSLN